MGFKQGLFTCSFVQARTSLLLLARKQDSLWMQRLLGFSVLSLYNNSVWMWWIADGVHMQVLTVCGAGLDRQNEATFWIQVLSCAVLTQCEDSDGACATVQWTNILLPSCRHGIWFFCHAVLDNVNLRNDKVSCNWKAVLFSSLFFSIELLHRLCD